MIKANDLKPGDLVRVCEDNWQIKKGTICEILSIDLFHKYCSELNWVTVSNPNSYIDKVRLRCIDIEGISLTPEILEKNGWKKRAEGWYFIMISKYSYLSVEFEYNDGIRVFLKRTTDGLYVKLNTANNIHELQHILWALGKNANFKI